MSTHACPYTYQLIRYSALNNNIPKSFSQKNGKKQFAYLIIPEKISNLFSNLLLIKNSKKFQKIPKDSKRFQKIPKEPKRFQKNQKESKRFQKNQKDSKRIQKIPKESKRFQKNQKESKRFQKNPKDEANKLKS